VCGMGARDWTGLVILFFALVWHLWTEAGRQRGQDEARHVKPLRMFGRFAVLIALGYGILALGRHLH
jgi:hypothetical protein